MSEPRPGLEESRRLLADADTVPVALELPMGTLTPVAAMRRLGTGTGSFLLESVEGSGKLARWSMLGHDPARAVSGGPAVDPLAVLEREVASRRVAAVPGIEAPLLGGAVGYLGYEASCRYERLPLAAHDPLGLPDAWFGIYDTVTVFDHARQRILLVSCVHRDDPDGVDVAHARALRRIEALGERLSGVEPSDAMRPRGLEVDAAARELHANLDRERFCELVARAHDYIIAGDIFQVQISRRFGLRLAAHPFDLYEMLRAINPSPYMFYVATPACTLAGASPEMLVQVTGRDVRYRPIAGTRRRGRTPEDDARMEAELRSSEKEAAEHLMLVDLGRNDLGRVCAIGTVAVGQIADVERYSHVMHLVSGITGTLASGRSSLDALRACFPAGTVTGAPKIRAMEIIAELEPEVRGAYAGAAGYVGYGGDLDTAIALRTVVARDGVAYVQAAAGIVADSSAAEEAVEIDNKVAALLLAVDEANAWAAR